MAKSGNEIDKELIRDLAALLSETDLSEIEIEQQGLRIRVARQMTVSAPVSAPAPAASAAAPAESATGVKSAAGSTPAAGLVTSPMVGTAYLSPEPGADPFVEIGSQVREGQTVLIVEAMKTMNPIIAPKSGKVTDIFVEDAQAVEYGEPMLVIS